MIKSLETKMWEALVARDKEAFLKLVDESAVMVCGGYRCLGSEYAEFIPDFDCAHYEIIHYEEVVNTQDICQVHYVVKTEIKENTDIKNQDLAGVFHVTSTWIKKENDWKLVFNMDSRIE